MKSLILIALLAVSLSAYSSCLEVIRDRLAVDETRIQEFHSILRNLQYREYKLESSLSMNTPSQKTTLKKEFIDEYLRSFEQDTQQKILIEHIPTIYSDPNIMKDWARGLAKEIVRETYRQSDTALLEQLRDTGKISREIFNIMVFF